MAALKKSQAKELASQLLEVHPSGILAAARVPNYFKYTKRGKTHYRNIKEPIRGNWQASTSKDVDVVMKWILDDEHILLGWIPASKKAIVFDQDEDGGFKGPNDFLTINTLSVEPDGFRHRHFIGRYDEERQFPYREWSADGGKVKLGEVIHGGMKNGKPSQQYAGIYHYERHVELMSVLPTLDPQSVERLSVTFPKKGGGKVSVVKDDGADAAPIVLECPRKLADRCLGLSNLPSGERNLEHQGLVKDIYKLEYWPNHQADGREEFFDALLSMAEAAHRKRGIALGRSVGEVESEWESVRESCESDIKGRKNNGEAVKEPTKKIKLNLVKTRTHLDKISGRLFGEDSVEVVEVVSEEETTDVAVATGFYVNEDEDGDKAPQLVKETLDYALRELGTKLKFKHKPLNPNFGSKLIDGGGGDGFQPYSGNLPGDLRSAIKDLFYNEVGKAMPNKSDINDLIDGAFHENAYCPLYAIGEKLRAKALAVIKEAKDKGKLKKLRKRYDPRGFVRGVDDLHEIQYSLMDGTNLDVVRFHSRFLGSHAYVVMTNRGYVPERVYHYMLCSTMPSTGKSSGSHCLWEPLLGEHFRDYVGDFSWRAENRENVLTCNGWLEKEWRELAGWSRNHEQADLKNFLDTVISNDIRQFHSQQEMLHILLFCIVKITTNKPMPFTMDTPLAKRIVPMWLSGPNMKGRAKVMKTALERWLHYAVFVELNKSRKDWSHNAGVPVMTNTQEQANIDAWMPNMTIPTGRKQLMSLFEYLSGKAERGVKKSDALIWKTKLDGKTVYSIKPLQEEELYQGLLDAYVEKSSCILDKGKYVELVNSAEREKLERSFPSVGAIGHILKELGFITIPCNDCNGKNSRKRYVIDNPQLLTEGGNKFVRYRAIVPGRKR